MGKGERGGAGATESRWERKHGRSPAWGLMFCDSYLLGGTKEVALPEACFLIWAWEDGVYPER